MALDPTDPSNFVKMNKWNYFDLIGYNPHPRQRLFHQSDVRFKIPICGRRFGKSVMAARELTPNLFLPNRRYWIVGPTYDLGEKEFRIIWNDLIIKLGLGRQREIKRSYSKKQGDLSIEFPWGTKLEVRSADRPDNLVGEGLHGVIMSEAAKHTEETWNRFIRPALTDYRGNALFPTCVTGNTLIATEDGIIQLGSLHNGEPVGTFIEYNKMVAGFVDTNKSSNGTKKATKFYVNGAWPTIKVTNGLGTTLEGTENHPVWAMRNGVAQWIELQELKIGDWIATRVGANVWGNNDDTADFDKAFTNGNQKDFDTTLNTRFMWLLGYIIGNGHIDFKNRRVSISTAEPEVQALLSWYGFNYYPNTNNDYLWTIGRKIFVEYLEHLGFEHKLGPEKVIPVRLLQCSGTLLRFLLSGLFDSDGTAHKNKDSVRLDSTSLCLIEQVQFLLANFGIIGRITQSWNAPSAKVAVGSTKYTLEVTGAHAQLFHEEIGFALKRKQRILTTRPNRFYGVPTQATRITKLFQKYSKGKGAKGPNLTYNFDYLRSSKFASYEKLESFLKVLEPYAWDDADWQYLKTLCDERYYWSQIKKLEAGEALTYDLVVPDTHAFVSNTMISHNTPEGQNWLYDLWKLGRNPEYADYESWQFPSWENPFVYPLGKEDPEIILTQKTTSEEEFLQEYAADFTNFSGKIYREWDEATHVQHVPFVPGLPNYIAFDWGYRAPMAAVEFQIDAFDRVRVWREHYKSQIRLKDFLDELKHRAQPDGYHLDLTFGDAADPEAVISVSEDFCPCYADPRSKSGTQGGSLESGWREGIELVKGFLKSQQVDEDEYGAPIEQPWLIVDHSCINIIREFNNYRGASAVRGKDPREAPHKSDDHALDALRYGLMHYFKLGATASLASAMGSELMMDLPDSGYFTSGKNFA